MSHPDIKLILSDIDGTLLPYGQQVLDGRTLAAFHAALDAGIHIGPASGRDVTHILPTFAGDEACVATVLATNGMQVYLDGRLIHEEHLSMGALTQVLEIIRDMDDVGLAVFSEKGTPQLIDSSRELLRRCFPRYADEATHVDGLPADAPVKANVFVDGGLECTRELMVLLDREVQDMDFNLPQPGFINMTSPGWSKASGIDVLCDALGIGPDQVVVFGDGGNDIEMLARATHSVAVADALPEAAAAARWHIGSCEDGAVPDAIEVIAAGEWPFVR